MEQAAGNDHFRAGRLEEALAAYLEGVRRAPGVRSVTPGGQEGRWGEKPHWRSIITFNPGGLLQNPRRVVTLHRRKIIASDRTQTH